jgi:hypothetical protein
MDMENFFKKYWVYGLFIVIGGIGGFLYWHYVGCASGTCPITAKWYTSSGYGMVMGGLLGDSFRKKSRKKD